MAGWPRIRLTAMTCRARLSWRSPRRLSVSGRAMIEALAAGERDPRQLAALAKGRLRAKLDALEMACDGRFTGAHGQM